MRFVTLIALVGCSGVNEPFQEVVAADGLDVLRATVERGDVVYAVGVDSEVVVAGESIARASSSARAEEREAANQWRVDVDGSAVVVQAESPSRRSSVDFDVVGPAVFDLDVDVQAGSVIAADVEGNHRLSAGRVQTTRLRGSANVVSNGGGVDVEVYPWVDGAVTIDSVAGDVILRLPFGGAYDVEILGDPDFELFVTELGFVGSIAQPGFFSGVTGDGSIPVRITARGGSVQLLEAL